jgi:hypothetical protein
VKRKNIGTLDRMLRVFLAEILIIVGFFWAGMEWQIILFLLAVVLLFQAATGVCGLYSMLRWNTCENIKRDNKKLIRASLALVLLVAVVGGYASAVLTRDIFIMDLKGVEDPYNSTIYYSGKDLRQESIASYDQLKTANAAFQNKYAAYRPFAVMFDGRLSGDMKNISLAVTSSGEDIHTGSLAKAHDSLEKAVPIFQEILRRNGLAQMS